MTSSLLDTYDEDLYTNEDFYTDEVFRVETHIGKNSELINLLQNLEKFNEINESTSFHLLGEGNSGKIYIFHYEGKQYGIKCYKKEITHKIPEINDNCYSVKSEYLHKNHKSYALFEYFPQYISLRNWISFNKNTQITHCYDLDKNNRWLIILNIVKAMYYMHQKNIYHRDIHPANIIIDPINLNIKFIDLDTICLDDEDCKKDLQYRVLQAKTYQINNFDLDNFNKYSYIYAQDLDYYAIGIVVLELLNVNSNIKTFVEKLKSISNDDDLKKLILDEFFYNFYPSCSIHKKIFAEFYEIFLSHCLNTKYYKSLFINITSIIDFMTKNFYKKQKINISGTLKAFKFNGNNNLMYHILTHAFYSYYVYIDQYKKDEYNYNEETDDFVIHGAFDIEPGLFNFYKCPYINLSIEPFRANISRELLNINNYPLLELNTYRNIYCYDTSQFDISLKTKEHVSFMKKEYDVYSKFSCNTNNFWLPFFVLFYIGQIPFNQEKYNKISKHEKQFDKRNANFLYIALNCSNDIRETLFKKLKEGSGRAESKTVVSLGPCQRTEDETVFIARQRGGSKWHNLLINKLKPTNNYSVQQGGNIWENNALYYSKSKFGLALENSLHPGYITEKIITVYSGGAIPIYWGPPEIKEFFNEKSFYYLNEKFKDPYNPTEQELNLVVEELYKLANDDSEETGWKKFLSQPVYKNDVVPDILKYRDTYYYEEIINTIKVKYPIQKENLKKSVTGTTDGGSDTQLLKKYLKYKNKYLEFKTSLKI